MITNQNNGSLFNALLCATIVKFHTKFCLLVCIFHPLETPQIWFQYLAYHAKCNCNKTKYCSKRVEKYTVYKPGWIISWMLKPKVYVKSVR